MNIPQRWCDALRALQDNGFPEAIIGNNGDGIERVDQYAFDFGE